MKLFTNTELQENVYHGEEYADYLSGSKLWNYFAKCPVEAELTKIEDSPALRLGSLTHTAILEPEIFEKEYSSEIVAGSDWMTSDAQMKSFLKENGAKGYSNKKTLELIQLVLEIDPTIKIKRVEEEKMILSGKKPLSPAQFNLISAMQDSMKRYRAYQNSINENKCEHSIIGFSETLGINIKTRPDILGDGFICNYKTAESACPEKFIRSANKFGYLMKEYFNAIAYEELFGHFPEIRFLVQSKVSPHVVTGVVLSDDLVEVGRRQFELAFDKYVACKEANRLIDYAQGEWITVEAPSYLKAENI